MVAPFFELNHSLAIIACLPALLFCHLRQAFGLFILGTFPSCVVLAVAQDTYFSAAPATAGIFSSSCQINANFTRFDPIPAALGGTIQVLGGCVLFELLVPKSLELIVEQTIDMLQWDVLLGAAARWHMGRILDRECELSLQTCVTHTMTAGELCCLGDGDIVVHTDETIDPDISSV